MADSVLCPAEALGDAEVVLSCGEILQFKLLCVHMWLRLRDEPRNKSTTDEASIFYLGPQDSKAQQAKLSHD